MMPAIIGLAHAGTKPLMGAGKPAAGGGGGVTSVSFIANTTSGIGTITAPATINAGDLIVLADFAESSTTPTSVTPTGFTTIVDTLFGSRRLVSSYKKAAGTEGGTTITGMAGATFLKGDKVMAVFRGNVAATTLTVASVFSQAATGALTNQVVTSSGGTPPLLVLSFLGSSVAPPTHSLSPAADGDLVGSVYNWCAIDYKIYNSSPVNVTAAETSGGGNYMHSCYITLA